MKNREKIECPELVLKCVKLGIAIQNKGIATAMIDVSGHVANLIIKLYVPCWVPNADADYDAWPQSKTGLQNTIITLENILNNGETAIPGFSEKKERERQKKIKQIEKLKSELGEFIP